MVHPHFLRGLRLAQDGVSGTQLDLLLAGRSRLQGVLSRTAVE